MFCEGKKVSEEAQSEPKDRRTYADARGRSELGALLLDLDGELTSGSDDEDDRSVSGGKEGLGVDVNHGGEGKGDGLSGSSGRDGDEVTSRESHGPRLHLNGRGSGETGALDLGHDVRGESHLVERLDGLGDALSEDLDLLGGAELGDLALGAGDDARVLPRKRVRVESAR